LIEGALRCDDQGMKPFLSRTAVRVVATSLFALSLTGCLKSRSQLRQESGGPDAGYQTKVTEVSAVDKNQQVVEELRGEINRLNSRIDELHSRNESLSKDLTKKNEREEQVRELDAKVQELQASQAALIDALQKKEQERQKEKEVPKSEPADAFTAGRSAYREKKYDVAIESLSQYLKYPKGKNAEEALLLRGEAYFAEKNYRKAILDYDALREKFPKSKNTPKATLKMAQSFDALGMKSDAKAFYQEILDKHPKSAEAKVAKTKLK
jgi:tol-pal system protein YbgF